jgi:Uma2 family endonuclease
LYLLAGIIGLYGVCLKDQVVSSENPWKKGTQPMALQHPHWLTVEDYHQIEENNPDRKFEYVDGQVFEMSGGTFEHSQIAVNLTIAIGSHLRGKTCRVVNSDIHVLPLGSDNPSYLPDVTVTCSSDDYKRGSKAVLSPRLIIEVLSPSTIRIDRTEKRIAYQACPSMQEYVMVSSQRQEVEVLRRGTDGEWEKIVYLAGETVLLLSIELSIAMNDIYADTDISPQDA